MEPRRVVWTWPKRRQEILSLHQWFKCEIIGDVIKGCRNCIISSLHCRLIWEQVQGYNPGGASGGPTLRPSLPVLFAVFVFCPQENVCCSGQLKETAKSRPEILVHKLLRLCCFESLQTRKSGETDELSLPDDAKVPVRGFPPRLLGGGGVVSLST